MPTLFQQAVAAHKAGRLEEAEQGYRASLDSDPSWARGNLGILYRVTGRLAEAESILREALEIDPESLSCRHSLGMTLLQLGQYAEGWRLYEARHQMLTRPIPQIAAPEWKGESLGGKRVLVVGEQGLGDQVLLSRFIPLLARETRELSLAVTRPLVRLLSYLPAKVMNPIPPDLDVDVWLSIGTVAAYLGVGPEAAPAPTLPLPPQGGRAPSGVGLMLTGAPANPNNANRLPPPHVEQAIRGLGDFVDLDPTVSGAPDFQATAEIIAGLDRVITIDTSVAHVAGALGKRVHIIAPRPAVDWYLNWKDNRTPWYPSARTIRQRATGDWAGVIAGVAAALD